MVPTTDKRIKIVSDYGEVNMLDQKEAISHTKDTRNHAAEGWIYPLYKDEFEHAVLLLKLDEDSKKYTTIITPDGQLYKYNQLPMEIKISSDEAQAIMEEILPELDVTCYIDAPEIWTNGARDKHLELVDKALQRIAESNLKTNPS